jgi:hypothetical protein
MQKWNAIAPPVEGLVLPVRVDPDGQIGPTENQSRGPRWRRAGPGWFVPSSVTDDLVEQRIVEEYARLGNSAVITGWAGLRLLGGGYFDGLAGDGKTRLPIPVAANGERLRARAGTVLLGNKVPLDEITVVHGMRVAVAERSLFDEMRRHRAFWACVSAVDMTCAAELTSLRRMQRYRWTRYWYRDIRMLDRVLPVCVEDAWSPPEVSFRRIWTEVAGWSRPLCNCGVQDLGGGLIGIPDLFDPERGVAGEYAGGGHRDRDQHESDLSRTLAFRRVGIEVVEVTGPHLRDEQLVAQWLREASSRAALLPRAWQLAPVGQTLDERLDQRAGGRRDTQIR